MEVEACPVSLDEGGGGGCKALIDFSEGREEANRLWLRQEFGPSQAEMLRSCRTPEEQISEKESRFSYSGSVSDLANEMAPAQSGVILSGVKDKVGIKRGLKKSEVKNSTNQPANQPPTQVKKT